MFLEPTARRPSSTTECTEKLLKDISISPSCPCTKSRGKILESSKATATSAKRIPSIRKSIWIKTRLLRGRTVLIIIGPFFLIFENLNLTDEKQEAEEVSNVYNVLRTRLESLRICPARLCPDWYRDDIYEQAAHTIHILISAGEKTEHTAK